MEKTSSSKLHSYHICTLTFEDGKRSFEKDLPFPSNRVCPGEREEKEGLLGKDLP